MTSGECIIKLDIQDFADPVRKASDVLLPAIPDAYRCHLRGPILGIAAVQDQRFVKMLKIDTETVEPL